MSAAFARLKSHLARWREWELNPIVVKELRQAVRSWAVTGMLLLFLIVLFSASLIFLISQSFDVDVNLGLGGEMFGVFAGILAFASVFFIPFYLGGRLAAERQENNPDLLYISTLSPARIIWGKFLCGAYITLLFFSACLPFMALTNLLRGVDLPTVFFILAFLFLAICGANLIAIFFACIPASRAFKVLFAVVGLVTSFNIMVSLIAATAGFMHSGVGTMLGRREFWVTVLTTLGLCSAAGGLFFLLSVALISPASANRALPLRLYITAIWLLGGLIALGCAIRFADPVPVYFWVFPTFGLMMFALLVTVSNSDQLSARVRRQIPPPGFKRLLAFFFYNGAAGGLLWVGLILAATCFAARTVLHSCIPPSALPSTEYRDWFATIGAYAFDYALTALLIQRKFFSRRPPKLTPLIAVFLAAAWAIVPYVVFFFLNQLSWKSVENLQLGNMFNYFGLRDDRQRIYHLYFAVGWLVVMLVLCARWFGRQVRNFRPLERIDAPPVLAEIPPVLTK